MLNSFQSRSKFGKTLIRQRRKAQGDKKELRCFMKIIAEKTIEGKTLRLIQGDITERDVDVIVNAANSHLQHGGGVAGAIVRKGGQVIQEESNEIGYTPVGTAVITGAGKLPARFVIHAVGPRMGEGDEDNKLKNAVSNSLKLASENGLKSISLPAISSGIFGFPKDRCAEILVKGALNYIEENPKSSLQLIEFCVYDDLTTGYFQREFDKIS
jgi:O-acetyl-ADP-ribose deacetylase (regulator of RNase III)